MKTKIISNPFGKCIIEFENNYVHIHSLYVHPLYRNKGHAKELLNEAISFIRESGWKEEIMIVARSDNSSINIKRLRSFYKKLGLTVFSRYA